MAFFSIAVVTATAGVPAVGGVPAVAFIAPVADTIAIAIVGIPADSGTVSGVLLLVASVMFFILLLLSSSSFIIPPATGHHRWSGASKNKFYGLQFYDTILYNLGVRNDS